MWSLVKFAAIAICFVTVPVKSVFSQKCRFIWDNGTDLTDNEFGVILHEILDTEEPGMQLLSVQASNVLGIKTISSNSISKKLYMEPILKDGRLLLKLTAHFVEYEENEISNLMSLTIIFECPNGTTKKMEFIQPIKDTNNHCPEFLNSPYIYTLPMPFPKNFELNHLHAISARDIDVTNANISFCLDPADDNARGFAVSWLSRDTIDRKRFHATLFTKTVVNFVEDVTFSLYATDAGNPRQTSEIKVTVKLDRESSILRFNSPLYIADLTNLTPEEANGKVIQFAEGEIGLVSGADKTVSFTVLDDLSDYYKNFALTVADDHSTVSLRLVDPPAEFFLENFVVLSLTAKKDNSEETTVLHLSLPGRVTSSVTSTTPETTISSDCKFTWDNGTDFPNVDFGLTLDRILDTEPPETQLLSVQATNVVKITDVTSSSTNKKLYMEPILNNSRLILRLTDHFVDYEENEISDSMTLTVTFDCLKGTSTKIAFIQPIEDTNNHSPEFVDEPYVYTLPMPFPKNIQLNHFQAISARDVDITNANVSFSLDSTDPNASGFSVLWLSKDKTDLKRYHATLVTEAVLNFVEDVAFTLKATDTGIPPNSAETKITIKVDPENSILRFAQPLYIADLKDLTPEEANGKVIPFAEGEISLGSGADKTVSFTIRDDLSDYDKNFALTVADDHSTVSLRLVDPPAKFFLESFVVLSLTATKSVAKETTILHISLPGCASVPEPSSTSPTTGSSESNEGSCPAQEECDNIDYAAAIIVLAILLLVATVGLVVSVVMNCRIRRKPHNMELMANGEQRMGPEMGEVRNGSLSPSSSIRRSVTFNDNVEETKIARL